MIELPTHNDMLIARRKTGLNQADVAKLSGVSLATIGRLERGGDVKYSNWVKLVEFYISTSF